jgi:hypothetical protein
MSGMANITSLGAPRGRGWGILAIVAVALPLPWLFTLVVLSLVVQSRMVEPSTTFGPEFWFYGAIASAGLLFFPTLMLAGTAFAITAIRAPRRAGKIMGWIAIGITLLTIPLLWVGYGVWINP